MALGRKKASAPTPTAPDAGTPISNAPEGFGDFSNIPSESTPPVSGPAARKKRSGKAAASGDRKAPPVALMGALGVLLVVGAGAGIYSFMNAGKSSNDLPPGVTRVDRPGRPGEPPLPGPPRPGAPRVALPGDAAPQPGMRPPSPAIAARPDAPAPGQLPARPAPGVPVPGRPGPAVAPAPSRAGGTAPVLKRQPDGQPVAQQPVKLAQVVPPQEPTPIFIATPLVEPAPGANPGILDRQTVRYVQPPSPVMVELKKLWEDGREAKQRKDYAAARAAWSEGLRIAQRDPKLANSARGFRESIIKLDRETAKAPPAAPAPPRLP